MASSQKEEPEYAFPSWNPGTSKGIWRNFVPPNVDRPISNARHLTPQAREVPNILDANVRPEAALLFLTVRLRLYHGQSQIAGCCPQPHLIFVILK